MALNLALPHKVAIFLLGVPATKPGHRKLQNDRQVILQTALFARVCLLRFSCGGETRSMDIWVGRQLSRGRGQPRGRGIETQFHTEDGLRRLGYDGKSNELVSNRFNCVLLVHLNREELLRKKDALHAKRIAELKTHGLRHVEKEGSVSSFHEVGHNVRARVRVSVLHTSFLSLVCEHGTSKVK